METIIQPKTSNYKHLSETDRIRIETLANIGFSARLIATEINKDKSTVARELKRNLPPKNSCKYRADKASERTAIRRFKAYKPHKLNNPLLLQFVEKGLRHKWSPAVIAGRWNLENPKFTISHTSIYRWIKEERNDLKEYLLHRRKYVRKAGDSASATKIPNRIDIGKRRQVINSRRTYWHWEADTMISARTGKSCLAVFVERKSRFYVANKIKNKTAETMNKATIKSLSNYPVKSITFDNGTENAGHEELAKFFTCETYFCKPYKSCEKGSIENRNKLVRQWIPKKTNLDLITQKELDNIISEINNRPMKLLGWKTPAEVIQNILPKVALHVLICNNNKLEDLYEVMCKKMLKL